MVPPTHLDTLLRPESIRTLFQPIYDIAGDPSVFAFEGLSRGPAGSNFESPDIFFSYARHKRAEHLLDRICIGLVLERSRDLPREARISVNVHASTLTAGGGTFAPFLAAELHRAGVEPSRLIVEVVEHALAWNPHDYAASVDELRAIGVDVALDDIGVGLSNYRMMIDTRPSYLKIDRYLVAGCAFDSRRSVILESIYELAEKLAATVIAEGIETEADLARLRTIGIRFVQGFLFSPPQPAAAFTRHELESLRATS
jgi:EAL domain-containing protein (putative c-di-GMP-specific phosphodiesterase class I)